MLGPALAVPGRCCLPVSRRLRRASPSLPASDPRRLRPAISFAPFEPSLRTSARESDRHADSLTEDVTFCCSLLLAGCIPVADLMPKAHWVRKATVPEESRDDADAKSSQASTKGSRPSNRGQASSQKEADQI